MEDTERYSRQILFSPIGTKGQDLLRRSRVALVGCGALGAAHAETLVRAGIGHLRIIDRDFVEFSNLQRQTLFTEKDASERLPKSVAAARRLEQVNSSVEIEPIVADITNTNVESLVGDADIVLDGSDNFQVRYLVNDACVKNGVPWVYGAAVSSYGSSMTIIPHETPCLRCIFDEMPEPGSSPTCDTAGVLMPVILTVSSIQTIEAIKFLIGDRAAMHGSLVQIDVWKNDMRKIALGSPNADCPACGAGEFAFLDAENTTFDAVLCGRDAVQISPLKTAQLDLKKLAAVLGQSGGVKQNEYLLRFLIDGFEMTVFNDGRAIIRGTDDVSAARSLYARYIGT